MAIDTLWSSVSLLMPLSSDLLDVKGHSVTANGGVALSSAVGNPFGAGNACYFDGTDDYLSLADSADWSLGSSDFTIEAFVRFVAHTSSMVIIAQRDGSTANHAFTLFYNSASSGITFSYTTNGVTNTAVDRAWSPSNGVWYHIAAIRSGTILRIKVDGTQIGADYTIGASTIFNSTALLMLGATNSTPTAFLSGYLSQARLTLDDRTITAAPTVPHPRPTISGHTYDAAAAPVAKVVVAQKRSTLAIAGQALSNGGTGLYTIYPSDFSEHVVTEFDTATYPLVDGGSGENAIIYDRVIPGAP